MSYFDAKCPICSSNNVTYTLYGYPFMTEELEKAMDEGKVQLGGCCIYGDEKCYHCNACGHSFNKDPEKEVKNKPT